jgi:hypothetical protein
MFRLLLLYSLLFFVNAELRNVALTFLKGQCHEMDIFFEGLNIFISIFRVCADEFEGLSKAFH